MVKIYALVSGQLVLYVGKTTRLLTKREYGHRCKNNDTGSKHIPEYIDWTIRLLEEVPDDQGIIKEQYYYDTLKPLYNRCRPGQSQKDSVVVTNNRPERKQYLYEKNKQYRLARRV